MLLTAGMFEVYPKKFLCQVSIDMSTEKFANRPVTTLSGGIDGVVTSLTVADASTFPNTGQFRILIDSEYLLVTGVSGNTFTVSRGIESSSPVGHSSGSAVIHVVTAGAMDLLVQTDDPRIGILTQVIVDISLTSTANTIIDTRPASPSGINRWKLVSIDLRLKTAITGGGTPSATISIGSTSGGTEIVITQSVTSSTPVGTIVGGFQLTSLGSDMSQGTGFEAMYPASQNIYANVVETGTPSTGTVTAYLLWQELP